MVSALPVRQNPRVRLTPNALEEFEEVRKTVVNAARMLDGREREFWAKIPAQVLRLAGTLSYLCWAAEAIENDDRPEPHRASVDESGVRRVALAAFLVGEVDQ